MKALSIKQPWASLIVKDIKDIENRTWKTNFRGKIYVHASAKPDPQKFNALTKTQRLDVETNPNDFGVMYFDELPTSAIIGEVEIVDCVINHESIWAEKSEFQCCGIFPTNNCNPCGHFKSEKSKGMKPTYNWVLDNPVLYEKPIPCKGKLSFWEPDFDIEECIWCSGKFDYEQMIQDNAGENYCFVCWKKAEPILKAEYDELVKNDEIDPLEENGYSFETGV